MSKKYLISGGSGLIGNSITEYLENDGHSVSWLTRKINPTVKRKQFEWNIVNRTIDDNSTKDVDVIIHLAGASVADSRWTKNYKQELQDSRVESTALIYESCVRNNHFPAQFMSASAIGYYGYDRGNELLSEDDAPGEGFLADLTGAWEDSALPFVEAGSKVSWLRTGIVFSMKSGALPKMVNPIKWGFGSSLGSGKQYLSWIHEEDQLAAIIHILTHGLSGPFNLVGPQPETNSKITSVIAKALGKPLFLPPIPTFLLRIIVGELADAVSGSLRISPDALTNSGFQFKHPHLTDAVKDILKI